MMRKYLAAYAAWIVAVVAMAGAALAWYRYVEEIGYKELWERLMTEAGTDGATEE